MLKEPLEGARGVSKEPGVTSRKKRVSRATFRQVIHIDFDDKFFSFFVASVSENYPRLAIRFCNSVVKFSLRTRDAVAFSSDRA